jgi:hypothetical protein
MWYVDEKKKCVECGQEFTFTARQQKNWFEVLKISTFEEVTRDPTGAIWIRPSTIARRPRERHSSRRNSQ